MRESLRILRYNTGTDKKAFVEFKEHFDAVIFNSTIVAYSGAAVADLVSMHKRKYIIDPQTHIFQQDISAIATVNKDTGDIKIKKSVQKYLSELPDELSNSLLNNKKSLSSAELFQHVEELATSVYSFQTEYVNRFIEAKEYDKYLKFAKLGPEPNMVIAPYFMIKSSYDDTSISDWGSLNAACINATISISKEKGNPFPIAAQIVLEKDVLIRPSFIEALVSAYSKLAVDYVFVWIDDFDSFESNTKYTEAFSLLISKLNEIGKKPIMAYGGYESIMLCNSKSPSRLFGVAQSVGYGEYRHITPVGGGMPVNKYYFLSIHRRLRFDDAANILIEHGYFSDNKSDKLHAQDYYINICDCLQCHEVIANDINNFDKYNDSTPFNIRTKNGLVSRNRPTTDASLIAARHFLYCKISEWADAETKSFSTLVLDLKKKYRLYNPTMSKQIDAWCKVYGFEAD